jgi:hypothetical protein
LIKRSLVWDEDDLIEIVEELHQNSMRFANCSISDYIIKKFNQTSVSLA